MDAFSATMWKIWQKLKFNSCIFQECSHSQYISCYNNLWHSRNPGILFSAEKWNHRTKHWHHVSFVPNHQFIDFHWFISSRFHYELWGTQLLGPRNITLAKHSLLTIICIVLSFPDAKKCVANAGIEMASIADREICILHIVTFCQPWEFIGECRKVKRHAN